MTRDIAEDETHSHVAPDPFGRPRLVAIWEGGYASHVLPEEGKLVIGRSQSCDLRIQSSAVSREHALVRAGEPPVLQDLGSSNGTRIDGRRLEPGDSAPIYPGRIFELGSALVVLQQSATGSELTLPPPPPAPEAEDREGPMAQIYRLVDLVASGTISVILQGETGVGKEVIARRIHDRSLRAEKTFLRINCAAFAESMVEAELFGYERGAFTGAQQAKPGLLESASAGTALLDEVAELSLPMQAKLLRAIGNREVLRVGSLKPRPIDVRFIAATNQDLERLIRSGRFRADLYFRLNGITLRIPPLRERRSEILPFAEQFAAEESSRLGRPTPRLSPVASRWLVDYHWPGNIRELRSIIERATLLSRGGAITLDHLPVDNQAAPAAQVALSAPAVAASTTSERNASARSIGESGPSLVELRAEVEQIERQRILDTIQCCGGNQTKAAAMLGISRRALLHRLDLYGLPRPRKRKTEKGV
jgi:DNA-binding NtrC family response regulator